MKGIIAGLLLASAFVVNAQSEQDDQDTAFFSNAKAEFIRYEKSHGHFIQTNNVKLHYLTWGRQTGKTIVWIHGTGSNAYEFYGFADSFVKQGYFVIAIDYYGHGFTPIPDKDVSLYHVADDIKFLLDHLKIKKAVVGGWSRGGSIATAFYDAHPGYVSALVLEDGGSVAWATNEHKQPIDSFATKIKKYFAANKGMDDTTFDTQFQALEFERSFSKRGAFVTLASLKKNSAGKFTFNPGVSELCGESSSQEFLTLEYRPFASAKLFGVSTILLNPRVIYRNLSVPMLILDPVSENDAFDFEDENRKLQEAHPNLIVHKVYKETSHALKWERPNEFLQDVGLFLSNIKGFTKN